MFEPFSYLEQLIDLRRSIVRSTLEDYPDDYRAKPHFISATLSHLLPAIPRSRHAELAREILFHQQWSVLDERAFFLRDSTTILDEENALARAAAGQAVIFCTMHVGSYRLLNSLLTASGVNFGLVVDHRTLTEQGPKFQELHRGARNAYGAQSEFTLLNAEESNMGLRAVRLLRKGTSLVFYIDGNTGVGGVNRRDDHMVRVKLLGNSIFARRGVAFLSHFAGVPVVPMVCERTGWLTRTLTAHPAIAPAVCPDRDHFCREATQRLFDILGTYLVRVPEQWEGWFYLYRFLDLEGPARAGSVPHQPLAEYEVLRFDDERFVLFEVRKAAVLFDRLTCRCTPLSRAVSAFIASFREPRRTATDGAPAALVGRGILRREAAVGD